MRSRRVGPALGLLVLLGCGRLEDESKVEGVAPVVATGADAAPDAGGAARRSGSITLTSGGPGFSASAYFSVVQDPIAAASTDPCSILDSAVVGATDSASAGEIAIDLPSPSAPLSVKLVFDPAQRGYMPAQLRAADRPDTAGAPIRVRAAGDLVPAFDTTVLSAVDARILEPAEGAVLAADSGDLAVRWSDAGNERVFVGLNVGRAVISCRFPAASGEGAIPAALLKKARASSEVEDCAGSCITLVLRGMRSTVVAAGDYDILVNHSIASVRELKAK